jgi:hypothetical protein
LKPRDTDPDIDGMRYAAAGRPLAPFLAVCLACGVEREISLDAIPHCECRAKRWGIAACRHCRDLVEATS